jgi:predicted amidophosphoribosyltransferase
VDLVPSPWVIALALVAALALAWFRRAYQRCPHCWRFVRRALRGWLRCPHCGRQYHRSVPRQR